MLSPSQERSGRAYSSPPAAKTHQGARSVSAQACPSETQRPRFHCRQVTGAPSALCAPTLQTPEEKQVFSINRTVCTNSLGTVNHPYQLLGTPWEPSSQMPAKGQPRKQAFLSKDSSFKLAMLTIFWRASYLTSWDLRNIMVWNEEDMDTIFPTYYIWEV